MSMWIMPAVLKQLMRHADVATTMKYCVSANAADLADELWASYGKQPEGNTRGNTAPKQPAADSDGKAVSR